ncbi:hypothetical protein MFFDBJGM_01139 [Pectobacterium versatile]|nr:hypothetical protein OA04_24650 [Pectobacterium versatile]GBO48130.1 hypothetical protein MFFDBJGM_01139 [Pectobacterium versatile]
MTVQIGFGVIAHFAQCFVDGVFTHRLHRIITTHQDKAVITVNVIGEILKSSVAAAP